MTELTIYEVLEESRDNPDDGPDVPPAEGSWTWWRTGPHPMGVWQAMDWREPDWGTAYVKNREDFPVMQDEALGESGDFGNYSCHACGYYGDGYSEPGHMTECDGVCKRAACRLHHGSPEPVERVEHDPDQSANVLYLSNEEYEWLVRHLEKPPKELPRLRALLEEH